MGNGPHDYEYVLLSRPKKGKDYNPIAGFKSSGQSCLASAEEHFKKHLGLAEDAIWHSHNLKAVLITEWAQMQAKRLLRSLRIKA